MGFRLCASPPRLVHLVIILFLKDRLCANNGRQDKLSPDDPRTSSGAELLRTDVKHDRDPWNGFIQARAPCQGCRCWACRCC